MKGESIDALANRVRPEFPLLSREIDGHPLAFLDSAASSQKPRRGIACRGCSAASPR